MLSEPMVGPPVLAARNKRLGGDNGKLYYDKPNQGSHLKEHNYPCSTLYTKGAHYVEPYRRCVLARLNTTTAQQRAIRTRADLQ
jgi:hypothetical protein